jgi:23S rRNA (pseudouridine1915-N3)-methyltransferase
VKILLASVGNRARRDAFDTLTELYLGRVRGYCELEAAVYRTEEAFLEAMDKRQGRVAPLLALLDSRGKLFSSEQFAGWLGQQREDGQQGLVFGLGPADGWSDSARKRARLLLSLGPMTLPHELARVVVSEQIYRAFTILAGHPYHSGH